MENIAEQRIAEKYGYETNSISKNTGVYLLKLLGLFGLYLVGAGIWWLVEYL